MKSRPWLCPEQRVVLANLHLSDREIAALLPGRCENGVKQFRRKYAMWKSVPRDRNHPRYPTFPQVAERSRNDSQLIDCA